MIGDDDRLGRLGASRNFATDHAHLKRLFGGGRRAVEDQLARHQDALGREPIVDNGCNQTDRPTQAAGPENE